jgi:DNA-binding XRE family transcriptional regulator
MEATRLKMAQGITVAARKTTYKMERNKLNSLLLAAVQPA